MHRARYLGAGLTKDKDREQHNAILIFVKIFHSALKFFSLTLTIAINRNQMNRKSGKSLTVGRIFPKFWELPATN
jgi:hypothetical protein